MATTKQFVTVSLKVTETFHLAHYLTAVVPHILKKINTLTPIQRAGIEVDVHLGRKLRALKVAVGKDTHV